MNEEVYRKLEFNMPIMESRTKYINKKTKKESIHKQYSLKIPKKVIETLELKKGDKIVATLEPIKNDQEYPDIIFKIVRDNGKN